MGMVGRLLAGNLRESKLRKMFDYRHEITRKLVETGDLADPKPDNPVAASTAGQGAPHDVGM